MSRDPFELELADLLKTELPGPAAELEGRALSALAGVRPRRHPNLVRVLLVLAVLLLLAAVLYATARRYFVEGTLRWREGTSEATASRPPGRTARSVS